MKNFRHFLVYKPFGMLCQFSKENDNQKTLADLDAQLPRDVYPVGRIDADSEGLILLTNDKSLNAAFLQPENHVSKVYFAQVEGIPTQEDLKPLERGVKIRIKKKDYFTNPARTVLPVDASFLPERTPPIRFRKDIPETWVSIEIQEGKNRQVRKMFAAIGFPVLRLVRVKFGGLDLRHDEYVDMVPGQVRELSEVTLS